MQKGCVVWTHPFVIDRYFRVGRRRKAGTPKSSRSTVEAAGAGVFSAAGCCAAWTGTVASSSEKQMAERNGFIIIAIRSFQIFVQLYEI